MISKRPKNIQTKQTESRKLYAHKGLFISYDCGPKLKLIIELPALEIAEEAS